MITLNHSSVLYHKFSWTKKRLLCSRTWIRGDPICDICFICLQRLQFWDNPKSVVINRNDIVTRLIIKLHVPDILYDVRPVPEIFLKESWSAPEKRKYQISKFPFREINGYKHHNYIECHRTEASGVFSLAPIPAVLRLGLGWREAKNSYLILEDLPMNGMVRVRWHCISSQHTSPHPCTRGELCAVWEE